MRGGCIRRLNVREVSSCEGIRLRDCFRNAGDNARVLQRFIMWYILAVITVTLCSAERSLSALCRLKTYFRAPWGNNVSVTAAVTSNIASINIERVYFNSGVNNDMDRIIDNFGRQIGRDSYFV